MPSDHLATVDPSDYEPLPPAPIRAFPSRLGNVRLIRELGRGAMGVVWLGRHELLDRDVAVKLLLEATAEPSDPSFEAFITGARAAAAVKHPSLTAIHHADVIDGIPYLVMEYVDGPSLADLLARSKNLSLDAAMTAVCEVAGAVAVLHDHGVVHRDIKPSNVMLDRSGRIAVTDFGLTCARAMGDGRMSPGTPAYMAPEMFAGTVTPRSDVYAIGATAFHLLSGALPFQGTLDEIHQLHAGKPLPVQSLASAGVPPAIIEVIERAMHKDATFRYKTARHFLRALEEHFNARLSSGARELTALAARRDEVGPSPSAAKRSDEPSTIGSLVEKVRAERQSHKPSAAIAPVTPSVSSPPDSLQVSIACVHCEYDLRSLLEDARCPECGQSVTDSIHPTRLIFADPSWLRFISAGARMLYWMLLLTWLLVLMIPAMLLPLGTRYFAIGSITCLIGGFTAFIIAVIFMTRREVTRTTRDDPVRRAARISLAAFVSQVVITVVLVNISKSLLLETVLEWFGAVAAISTAWLVLLYLSRLSRRVPDRTLSSRLFQDSVGALILGALFAVMGWMASISSMKGSIAVTIIAAAAYFGIFGGSVLVASHLGRFRKRIRGAIQAHVNRDQMFTSITQTEAPLVSAIIPMPQ